MKYIYFLKIDLSATFLKNKFITVISFLLLLFSFCYEYIVLKPNSKGFELCFFSEGSNLLIVLFNSSVFSKILIGFSLILFIPKLFEIIKVCNIIIVESLSYITIK